MKYYVVDILCTDEGDVENWKEATSHSMYLAARIEFENRLRKYEQNIDAAPAHLVAVYKGKRFPKLQDLYTVGI